MNNDTVTAILWTLVAVCFVLWFTGLVTEATDASLWSHETPSHRGITRDSTPPRYP